jgi:TrmH family RNA methyltransferase
MLAKNEAKFINSLKLKKNRDAEGLFVAEGVKIVNELLNSGIKVKQIYSSRNFQLSIFNYHIDVIRIKENELGRISSLHTPNDTNSSHSFLEKNSAWYWIRFRILET